MVAWALRICAIWFLIIPYSGLVLAIRVINQKYFRLWPSKSIITDYSQDGVSLPLSALIRDELLWALLCWVIAGFLVFAAHALTRSRIRAMGPLELEG